jgi:hypothetical protein
MRKLEGRMAYTQGFHFLDYKIVGVGRWAPEKYMFSSHRKTLIFDDTISSSQQSTAEL